MLFPSINRIIPGQVPYEKPDDPPIALKRLFEGDSPDAKHFQAHARQYHAFSFSAKRYAAPIRQSRSTSILLPFWDNGTLLRRASSKS